MGTLHSYDPACQGHTYNGVLLGEPAELDGDPLTYEWDDSAFPTGECYVNDDNELVVIPDETDL